MFFSQYRLENVCHNNVLYILELISENSLTMHLLWQEYSRSLSAQGFKEGFTSLRIYIFS